MTTTTRLPANLRNAYSWTLVRGELDELAHIEGAHLRAYVGESATIAARHPEQGVCDADLLALHDWLRALPPAPAGDGTGLSYRQRFEAHVARFAR